MSEEEKRCVSNLARAISGNQFKVELSGERNCNGKSCFIQFVSKWETFEAAKEEGRCKAINEANNNGCKKVFAKGFVIGTRKEGEDWKVCFVSDSHDGLYAEFCEYMKSASPKKGGSGSNLDEFVKKHC